MVDVVWAPYSSTGNSLIFFCVPDIFLYFFFQDFTFFLKKFFFWGYYFGKLVFACAILEKVFVYDLSVDKHSKLAE